MGLILFIVLALLVIFWSIGSYLIYSGLRNRRLARESTFWPVAGGTVLSSEVTKLIRHKRRQRVPTTYYLPRVHYKYRVAGTDYESAVIRFGDLESGDAKFAEEFVTKYPAGATIAVRYDPREPSRATLETVSAGRTQIWTGAIFIVVPLIIIFGIVIMGALSEDMQKDLPSETLEQLNRPN